MLQAILWIIVLYIATKISDSLVKMTEDNAGFGFIFKGTNLILFVWWLWWCLVFLYRLGSWVWAHM
jgi:hypothetical protein